MKVLYYASTFPRHEGDTEDPWQAELVRRLADQCELTVLAPAWRGLASHRYYGIPVQRFRYLPAVLETLTHGGGASVKARSFSGKIKSLFYLLAARRALKRHLRLQDYDILHLHWPVPHAFMVWPWQRR